MEGKHVVITGGSGGLGSVVAQVFVDAGAEVHIPCVEAEIPTRFTLSSHRRVHCQAAVDLRDEGAVAAYFESLPSLWASVHITGGFSMAPVAETTLDQFRTMLDLNAVTCFLTCREAVRAIRRSSGSGRIVNVAARPALEPVAGMIAYAASKAAVASLTQSLNAETHGEGILVNAVVPSIIDTSANRSAMPDADHDRWPKPVEIAAAIAFLASPTNALTGGALIPVYGRA